MPSNLTPTIHDKEFTMPTVTLDATTVRTATCPPGQRKLDLYDTTIPGFVLEVRPSGGKTYYLRYRDAHGKQKQLRLFFCHEHHSLLLFDGISIHHA